MFRSYIGPGCLLLLASALAAPAADAEKDAVKAKGPKEAKEKLIAAGLLAGRVAAVDGDTRTLTVQVTLRYLVANDDAVAQQADLRQQLVDALGIEDPDERLQRVREVQAALLANQADLLRIEETEQEVTLPAADDVKVRLLKLPPAFDDKGGPRKYTAQELKDLKGPGNLVGYTADFSDLKEGQTVRVTLAQKKRTAKELRDAALAGENLTPVVTLAVIVAQPDE